MKHLAKLQFDILTAAELHSRQKNKDKYVEIVNNLGENTFRAFTELVNLGYLTENGEITESGVEMLEPYRVKRAVFMAAGFGSRMVPITLNTPKPLVRVKGKRIIDSLLNAVIAADISEIYIVRGYLGEQFDQLLNKYPMIKFIDNPMYNEANNIGSVWCAGDLISNSYILEGDLLLYNPKLIRKYQYSSNYLAIPMERSEDWCCYLKDGIIDKIGIGGMNCYQIVGISYWTEEDGKKLARHIKEVWQSPGGKECYLEQVPFGFRAGEYAVTVRECSLADVIEIDTFSELKAIDKTYDV